MGFDPHSGRCVVSLSKIHLPPKEYWLYSGSGGSVINMTEKLLIGTLNLNKTKESVG